MSMDSEQPFTAGQVVECTLDGETPIDVTNYQKVFIGPPSVEGDVQIFDDPECTRYATGVKNEGDKVYARVNVPWGRNEAWSSSSSDTDSSLFCGGPDEDHYYGMILWTDFMSGDYTQPFTIGQVVELTIFVGTADVTNYQKVFTKPTN